MKEKNNFCLTKTLPDKRMREYSSSEIISLSPQECHRPISLVRTETKILRKKILSESCVC